MVKKYIVELTDGERSDLMKLVSTGKASARKNSRARILLLADEDKRDEDIVDALKVGLRTVERTRQRFVEEGIEVALNDRRHPGKRPKLDGSQTAYLTALACSDPPEGRERWTLQLLAEQLVEAGVVDAISGETVRQVLKKATSSPGASSSGASQR
jgi:transposase